MPQIANGEAGGAARAKINAVLPQAVAFSTLVPLDGRKIMVAQAVAGPLAFTPAADPQLGGEALVRLTANGTDVPTFAGFAEHGASAGFFNAAGVVNLVRFWCDGTTSWFAISQALNVVPFAMQAAAVVAGDPGRIAVTFDRQLNPAIVPAAAAFALTNSGGADTVTAVAIAGGTVTLTKSRATLAGDVLQLRYTPPAADPLTDTNGNVAAGSAIAVTNGIGAAGTVNYLRLTTVTGLAESSNGGGYDYAPTGGGGYGGNHRGVPAKTLPAGADGWAGAALAAAGGGGPIIGLAANMAPATYDDALLCIFCDGGTWSTIAAGAVAGSGIAAAAGDIARVRREGTSLLSEVSKDGGVSWTVAKTVAGVTAAALLPYFETGAGTNGRIVQPRASANVG